MKKIFYISAALVAALLLNSCERIDHAKGQKVTYYANFTLDGDNPMIVPLGGEYVEPGFTAILGGEDVTSAVVVESNVNTETFGAYSVKYTCVNSDGFSSSTERKVYVLNPGHIDNLYNCSATIVYQGVPETYDNVFAINKVDGTDNVYAIDDLMGGVICLGWYPGYEAYGYDFWCEATFAVNPDNSLSLLTHGGWYYDAYYDYDSFAGTYDPESGILEWSIHRVEGPAAWPITVTLEPYSI